MKSIYDHNGCGMAGWTFKILFGRGAGYIGGRTFYVAWRPGSARWYRRVAGRRWWRRVTWPFQVGMTANANLVPYCTH